MQAARGLVGLGVELAAGVQRRHDDFERRLLREFRMVLDRDAAAVVDDGDVAVGAEMHLDAAGMAGDRLVHRVVDDFGEEVVQRVGVGAADIHARAAAHRLEPLQHLDVGGRIGRARRRLGRSALALGGGRRRVAEEVIFGGHGQSSQSNRRAGFSTAERGGCRSVHGRPMPSAECPVNAEAVGSAGQGARMRHHAIASAVRDYAR